MRLAGDPANRRNGIPVSSGHWTGIAWAKVWCFAPQRWQEQAAPGASVDVEHAGNAAINTVKRIRFLRPDVAVAHRSQFTGRYSVRCLRDWVNLHRQMGALA